MTYGTTSLAELSTFYTREVVDPADIAQVGVAFGLFVFVHFNDTEGGTWFRTYVWTSGNPEELRAKLGNVPRISIALNQEVSEHGIVTEASALLVRPSYP